MGNDPFTVKGVRYRAEMRRCGKPLCNQCPHGPYWFARYTDDRGKRRVVYIGRELPSSVMKEKPHG